MTGNLARQFRDSVVFPALNRIDLYSLIPRSLVSNNLFAAAMARVRYYVVRSPIPSTLEGQAGYWRKHYNGESPHGLTEADYIKRWNELCAPLYGPSTTYSPPDHSGYPYTPLRAPRGL